jgi:hypothetical protein
MIAVCREHHDKADAGAFSREQLHELKTKQADRVEGRFEWMRRDLLVVVGGNFYLRTPVPVAFRSQPVVATTRDDQGQLLVNFSMLSASQEPRISMVENYWISEGKLDDLECPPNGRRIVASYENGDLLRLEFFDVDEPEALASRYAGCAPGSWGLPYPITAVELQMRVGGTPIDFGPTETNLPGGNIIRGCFSADCGVGLAIG